MSFVIERAAVYDVPMELRTTFTASSHIARRLRHLLVRFECEGLVGWGECVAPIDPYYVGETSATAWGMLETFLLPAIVGVRWEHPRDLIAINAEVKENTFARAAIEAAAWDVYATARNLSLAHALGGRRRSIAAGMSIGLEKDTGRLVERISAELASGYRRVKLKVARGQERATLTTIRSHLPDLALTIDANGGYRSDDQNDLALLHSLDEFKLEYLEQPFAADDLVGHAELARAIKTPICLDEGIRSLGDLRTALALGSASVICIKPGRVGGFTEAIRIHDACVAANVPVWCGGMHEYGIGRAGNIALATLPGFTLPGDISGSEHSFARDLIDPPVVVHEGKIAVSKEPGLGYAVDHTRINRTALRKILTTK